MLEAPPLSNDPATLRLIEDGAECFVGAASKIVADLLLAVSPLPSCNAGTRLFGFVALAPLLDQSGPLGALAGRLLGPRAQAVRALMFDKNIASNWSLDWHQDRVIAVRERIRVDGFSNWTVKDGVPHVSPPWDLLRQMLTLRIHLDRVSTDNAPLRVAPGSHRLGLIAEPSINATVRDCGIASCLAEVGDVWVYSTPILHASAATTTDRRRRVLQLDYASFDLPSGLQWQGI